MKINSLFLVFVTLSGVEVCFAQPTFSRFDSIPVKENNVMLKMPWTGGHNFCQFSDIDLDFDGKKDLFVFDRTGNKITTYLNNGTPNTVDYVFTEQFANKFPKLNSWAILLDYNCDGKEDIMTYAMPIAGIKVWKNTSSAGNLQFTLEKNYIRSNYNPSVANLYVSQVDIPAIEDIDNDGDMDVLTYDFSGVIVEYHKNLSVENGYGCDSLIFQLDASGCWGNFSENASNCSINLGQSCRMSFPHEAPPLYESEKENAHSGSCALCLDMDADGDQDLIIGDVSCCNMTLLINGGDSLSANMTAFEDSFPANTQFVQQAIFPCGYAVDVNNDGKRDLLVSPNQPNTSLNKKSIWYYQNTNTDSLPVFSYVKNNFLQEDMIDVGEGAQPVLFDYTSDGLFDLLIANSKLDSDTDSCVTNSSYNMHAYKNTGTATNPVFEYDTNDFANLSIQLAGIDSVSLYPTFGDLDNDGDSDMFIGAYNGRIHYFENTAATGNPANFILSQPNYQDDAPGIIDVGNNSAPQIIDVNRDGIRDLIIGEKGGNINYYQNIGTALVPLFTPITDSLGKINVASFPGYGYSIPFMYDYNGEYNLFVGCNDGTVFFYDSIDGNLSGKFLLVDSSLSNIREGIRSAVTGADINGDYMIDMIVGNYCGGVSFWKGYDSLLTNVQNNDLISDLLIFPNPSQGQFNIQSAKPEILEIEVYDICGQLVLKKTLNTKFRTLNLSESKSGIYFCVLKTQSEQTIRKLSIVR